MKQHITKEQLDELNGNYPALDKLNDWIHSHGYQDEGWAEYFTIGRMIEFLVENDKNKPSYIDESVYDTIISGGDYHDEIGFLFDIGWRGELCDVLWNKVKKVL